MKYNGVTHTGLVRKQNQDCYDIIELHGSIFAVVLDGMGGPLGGEIASSLARDKIREVIVNTYTEDMTEDSTIHLINTALNEANSAVFNRAKEDLEHGNMGTTAVLAAIKGEHTYVASIGDSRAYLYSAGELSRITHDHSVVQEMLDGGGITEAEALIHPQRNIITRALGTKHRIEADLFEVEAKSGDKILLCSDGLTNMVVDKQIEHVLSETEGIQSAVESLLDMAMSAGATDNVTIVILNL